MNFANDNVERVRRAHQNDIENIVPFAILSGLYLAVANPSLFTAKCVFYGFTVARVLHTFVYLNQVTIINFAHLYKTILTYGFKIPKTVLMSNLF